MTDFPTLKDMKQQADEKCNQIDNNLNNSLKIEILAFW